MPPRASQHTLNPCCLRSFCATNFHLKMIFVQKKVFGGSPKRARKRIHMIYIHIYIYMYVCMHVCMYGMVWYGMI